MVRKIKNIIIGWYRYLFHKEPKYARDRRWICNRCSHKSKLLGKDICSLCGCFIEPKTLVEDEKCLDGRW